MDCRNPDCRDAENPCLLGELAILGRWIPTSLIGMTALFSFLPASPGIPCRGWLCRNDESSLCQTCLQALHGLLQIRHAGGDGQAHMAGATEGRAGNEGHTGCLDQ